MQFGRVDLLKGNIAKALGRLAVPIMGASVIQMAYSLIDMIWIGRLGATAVAAVGTGGLFMWFADSFMLLARIGGQVQCAQAVGAGRQHRTRQFIRAALQLGILFGLMYGALLFGFRRQIVSFLRFNEPETVRMTLQYMAAISPGIVCTYLSKILSGLSTATGNSRTPFMVTAIGLVCNMALDPLMIFTLGWGAAGAGIATTTSLAIEVFLFTRVLRADRYFRNLMLWRPVPKAYYRRIIRISYPVSLQELIYSGASILLSRIIAAHGDSGVAAHRIGANIESIAWLSSDGLANSVNALIGQNFGAGQLDRSRRGYRTALCLSLCIGSLTTALFFCLPRELMTIFVNDALTIQIGGSYLRIMSYSQTMMCLELMTVGAFAGYGRTVLPALVSTALTACRLPLAHILNRTALGLDGVWWAITITSILKGIILVSAFLSTERKLQSRQIVTSN